MKAELMERGLDREAVDKLQPILELSGDNAQKLNQLKEVLAVSETGMKGIEEMETVFGYVGRLGIDLTVELDLSLARGLNYYTGAIFEVKALDFAIGSICGGGRYDDLTGIFGMPNMSGVGISFGADRIYDVMTGLSLFPEEVNSSTRVLFVNLGAERPPCCRCCVSCAGVNRRRNLPRGGQDEEADGVRQPPRHPLCGDRGVAGAGGRGRNRQGHAHG